MVVSEDPVIYTTADIQRILKCGRRQAYDIMKSPAFPSIQIGTKYIVTKQSLEEWLIHNQGRRFLV